MGKHKDSKKSKANKKSKQLIGKPVNPPLAFQPPKIDPYERGDSPPQPYIYQDDDYEPRTRYPTNLPSRDEKLYVVCKNHKAFMGATPDIANSSLVSEDELDDEIEIFLGIDKTSLDEIQVFELVKKDFKLKIEFED